MNLYIRSMRRDANTGIVKSILWVTSKVSDDGKFRAETNGEQFLHPKQINDPSFIEYSNIDLETAEKWLHDSFGETGLKTTEEYLDAILAQKASESEIIGNPWEPVANIVQTPAAPTQSMRRTSFPVTQS